MNSDQNFNFETYVINSLKEINETLKGLNTVFMPREEILLRMAELAKEISTNAEATTRHALAISKLQATDATQQGMIDAKKQANTRLITTISVISALIGALAAVIGALWWVKG